LGNDNTNSEAERLSYTMTVDANNALFVYRYAVVLEDPAHDPSEQPRFEIRMFDQSGTSITCGLYNVYSSASIPGFVTITNQFGSIIHYKNWTTVGMDLSSYIGQSVTIEFSTGDCSLGAHYGYAYIDCYCSPLTISSDFCPGSNVTTLNAPVGFASYQWFDGQQNPLGTSSSLVITTPAEGDAYSCLLTSVTGCTATLSTTLTPSVVASGYGQVGDCMNAVQFFDNSTVISGPPISTWHWIFGDGSTSDLQNPFHSFDQPGDHEVRLVVTSDADCPDTLVQTITLLPAPVAHFSFGAVCQGQPLTLVDGTTSGNPIAGRVWDFGDGSAPLSTDLNPVHLFPDAGSFDVTLIVQDVVGCSDTAVATVTINPVPVVNLGPDTVICQGAPFMANAGNPGCAFSWSNGATGQYVSPAQSGNLWVAVINSAGCIGRDTIAVQVNPLPTGSLHDTTLCTTQNLILDAGNPGCSYAWSTGESTRQITPPHVSGNVSVLVTTPLGCTLSMGAQFTFAPELDVDLGPDQGICLGQVVELDAGSFPGATYLWCTNSPFQTATFANDVAAWVDVSNGYCHDRDTVLLTFDPVPIFSLADTTLCAADPLVLYAGNPGSSYLWTTGDSTESITISGVSGTYGLTVTSPAGCQAFGDAVVVFYPVISLDLGPDQVHCDGDTVVLDAGMVPGGSYIWNTGQVDQIIHVASSQQVALWAGNGYCQDADTVNLLFNPMPVFQLADTVLCVEQQLVLDAGNPGCNFLWTTGATSRAIVVDGLSGNYGVTVTTPQGCTDSRSIEATFMPSIVLDLGLDTVLCDGETLALDAGGPGPFYHWNTGATSRFLDVQGSADLSVRVTNGYCANEDSIAVRFVSLPDHAGQDVLITCFEDPRNVLTLLGSTSGTLFDWSTGDTTRNIQVREFGAYTVIATNPPRCETVDTITVMEYCPPRVFIPNSFTPDGDGVNDLFFPVVYNVIAVELSVFDRWGEEIFTMHGDQGGWDGTLDGKKVPLGVYTWRFVYDPLLADGALANRETTYGHVTVVR
jgi:gliding motility-associated-like protein